MGQKYVCEDCGWRESIHIYRGANVAKADHPKLSQVVSGYLCIFMECSGYLPSPEEQEAITQQEKAVGAHEGQH